MDADGNQAWYRDGKLHREGGPAVINANVAQVWYRDGRMHREGKGDPLAVIYDNGTQEWFLNGVFVK